MKQTIFTGSGVALITPMKEDGTVNYDMLGELIEFQIKNGTDAIISCGTTGESATLSDEEHREIIKYTIEKVNKRIPVVAGTGSNNTMQALARSKEAEGLGADALLIVTPYYNKASQDGLVNHYSFIANNTSLPIILYNVPSRTGCNIQPETYLKLSKYPNIVAIKEANGDISSVAQTLSLCGDNLDIYSGNDDQTIPIMSLGGKGVISVFANICPKESHEIAKKYLDGDNKSSIKIFLDNIKLMNALFSDVNPIPVKTALNLMGYNCGGCRMPLSPMSETKLGNLKNIMQSYELLK